MKKFAVLVIAAVTLVSTLEPLEAQVLRRFRSNVRDAVSPQNAAQRPQVRLQSRPSTQPQYVPPQVRTQRPAPGITSSAPQQLTPYSRLSPQQRASVPQPSNGPKLNAPVPVRTPSAPQQLTPYSRLSPQQRASVPQPSNGPKLNAPVPARIPSAQPADANKVRIVTYYDPHTRRSFQRRYLVPANSPAVTTPATRGQVIVGRQSIFTPHAPAVGAVGTATGLTAAPTIAQPSTQPSPSLVPPIQFSTRVANQPVGASPVLSPPLAGPTLTSPVATTQAIAASIDNSAVSSQVETASAEVEIALTENETSPEGIPDLSGITVEPAPVDSKEEESQNLFFDDESSNVDETADETDEINFSVLEEFEEE